jgi:hypothetical protein
VLVLVLLAVLGVGAVAQEWLGRRLEQRFRSALLDGERTGTLDQVSVCLPCLSYTIRGVEMESEDAGASTRYRLVADSVVVALDTIQLLRARLRGRMELPGATLHVVTTSRQEPEDAEEVPPTFGVAWQNIGRGLFPFPFARITSPDSEVILHYERFAEPVEWHFGVRVASVENLVAADGDPHVVVAGETPGSGDFEFELRVQDRDPPRSTFRGSLRAVPLPALDVYLRERFGLDVDGGEATARVDLAVDPSGWRGQVDCEVADLAVFSADDLVEEGLLQAATDGMAEVVTRVRRDGDGVLRMHLEIDERVEPDESEAWPWTMAGRIARWVLLAPFELPLRLVRSAETP